MYPEKRPKVFIFFLVLKNFSRGAKYTGGGKIRDFDWNRRLSRKR